MESEDDGIVGGRTWSPAACYVFLESARNLCPVRPAFYYVVCIADGHLETETNAWPRWSRSEIMPSHVKCIYCVDLIVYWVIHIVSRKLLMLLSSLAGSSPTGVPTPLSVYCPMLRGRGQAILGSDLAGLGDRVNQEVTAVSK